MKELLLTCPFTGLEFNALEFADGNITVIHPLTGEQLALNWNSSINRYNIPKSFFKHIETMSPSEIANELGVSKQRVSQIIRDEIIPVHYVNNSPVFLKTDVLEYKETRKVGAPKKEGK